MLHSIISAIKTKMDESGREKGKYMDTIKLLKKPKIIGEENIDLYDIKKFQVEINPLNKRERKKWRKTLKNKIIKVKGKLGTFSYTAEIKIDEINNLKTIVDQNLINFMNKNLIIALQEMWREKGAEFETSAKEYYKDDNDNK